MGTAIVEIYASASSGTPTSSWTCPSGVTRAFVECWGGGGSGGGGTGTGADGGGGGGGGAYAASWLNLVSGKIYNYVIASASRGGIQAANGLNASGSWFGFPSTASGFPCVFAAGGGLGYDDTDGTGGNGGAGGNITGSYGQYKWNGGNGGKGRNSTTGRGGSGGASAGVAVYMSGYSGTGTNPMSISGSSGYNVIQTAGATPQASPAVAARGGPGATAPAALTGGVKPTSGPGGGGSGAAETGLGGDGYPGQVVISYIRQSPSSILLDTIDELEK